MPVPSLRVLVIVLPLASALPLQAQHDDRIWGRVLTRDGGTHEGFVRLGEDWDAASWTDLLRVSKAMPDRYYLDWREATAAGRPHLRTVELEGYRITWEERHPDWPGTTRTGIRFGHLAEMLRDEDGKVRVATRSRRKPGLEAGEAVPGGNGGKMSFASEWGADVVVDDGDSRVEVDGRDIVRIEFEPAPAGTAPASPRLYGTAEDRNDRSFTGFVTWGGDILESDVLDGIFEDVPGLFPGSDDSYETIRFSHIRSVEPTQCGAILTSRSGKSVELCTEPLAPDPPPVLISDPALGAVDVEWDALRILRLEPSSGAPGYDAFDGGHPLAGTVVTAEGEEIEGRIRWDADEEWSWEPLQGRSHDVAFSIEFGNVARIERDDRRGAHVTLLDGRRLHMTRDNDVDEGNKGIFIFPFAADGAGGPAGAWRYVAWKNFREARFHHDAAGRAGS